MMKKHICCHPGMYGRATLHTSTETAHSIQMIYRIRRARYLMTAGSIQNGQQCLAKAVRTHSPLAMTLPNVLT